SGRVTVVIGAVYSGDWRPKAGQAELFPARFADVERLEAAPDILAGHDLLARQLLRVADCFGYQNGVVDAAVVEILSELVLLDLALALVHDVFLDVLERGIVRPKSVEVEREIAFGFLTAATSIVITARPPDADEMIHGEAVLGRALDRRRIHRAPAPHDHPRRTIAADRQPLRRLVLHFLAGNRILLHREAI